MRPIAFVGYGLDWSAAAVEINFAIRFSMLDAYASIFRGRGSNGLRGSSPS